MRIVLDGRCIHAHMGGIGRVALGLARALAASPQPHTLLLLCGTNLPPGLALPPCEMIQTEAAMIDPHFEQFGLPSLLEDLGADLYVNPTFSLPALKTTRWQIAFIHDVVFEDHPEWVEEGLRAYLRRWSRFSAENADRIITVSDHARGRICATYGLDLGRIAVIPNGVDPLGPVAEEAIAATRDKFRLSGPYILYLGSMEIKKGVPELLAAFASLPPDAEPGVMLVLAGAPGGETLDLPALIRQHGCGRPIRHMGYVSDEDRIRLLAGCCLFVYPSKYEGFGLPPLEAMALGRPCVVSNATSLPEVVGDAALQADVSDRESLAAALHRGLTDREFRDRAAITGPAQARRFSWPNAAASFLQLCAELEAA